jgi:PKD repeat protein
VTTSKSVHPIGWGDWLIWISYFELKKLKLVTRVRSGFELNRAPPFTSGENTMSSNDYSFRSGTPGRCGVSLLAIFLMAALSPLPLRAQFFTRIFEAGAIVTDSVVSAGVSWNDYNHDGYLDMYVSGIGNQMYHNQGDGTFARLTQGHFVNADENYLFILGIWADYNNDGYQDLFRGNFGRFDNRLNLLGPAPSFLYKNDGPPNYTLSLVNLESENAHTPSSSWVDFDRDGDVDLFLAGAQRSMNRFYRNDGNNNFVKLSHLPFLNGNVNGSSETWVDYDNDGDQDLYFVNQGLPNELYKSLLSETGKPDRFEPVVSSALLEDGSLFDIASSWGDYDNDGDLDVFIAFSGVFGNSAPNRLFQNNGDGTFTRIASGPLVEGRINSSFGAWGDYDNDGDLDLFVGRVLVNRAVSTLFRNEGNGTFRSMDSTEVGEIIASLPAPQAGSWGDYDNDGDLDMYIANWLLPNDPVAGKPQPNYLIRNNGGNKNNWLMVKCIGELSNKSAIGAKIKLKANISGRSYWQMRYIFGSGIGNTAQGDLRAHFGLGNAGVADSLQIEWPSGIRQILTQVNSNQILTVAETVPNAYLQADFTADTTAALDADSLTVHFTDLSFTLPGFPILSWQWDFNDDGIIDANAQNPTWKYAQADTYTVRLTVSNGARTESKVRKDFIKISGLLPIIQVDTRFVALGNIDINIPAVQRSFYVHNRGGAADSIAIVLDSQNVNPPSAIAISPSRFALAARDSQEVFFTIIPRLLPSSNTVTYRPKAVITSRFGYGTRFFEKSFAFRIVGTLAVTEPAPAIPEDFNLSQNHPNPFHRMTHISFQLAAAGYVSLKVFDFAGHEVKTLQNKQMQRGSHQVRWDGTNEIGEPVAAGIYFIRLTAATSGPTKNEKFVQTKKMVLLD